MKKILLICVNYNSYDALHSFLESIDCAAKEVTQSMEIHVAVADNSSDIQEIEESVYPDIHIEIDVRLRIPLVRAFHPPLSAI